VIKGGDERLVQPTLAHEAKELDQTAKRMTRLAARGLSTRTFLINRNRRTAKESTKTGQEDLPSDIKQGAQ